MPIYIQCLWKSLLYLILEGNDSAHSRYLNMLVLRSVPTKTNKNKKRFWDGNLVEGPKSPLLSARFLFYENFRRKPHQYPATDAFLKQRNSNSLSQKDNNPVFLDLAQELNSE